MVAWHSWLSDLRRALARSVFCPVSHQEFVSTLVNAGEIVGRVNNVRRLARTWDIIWVMWIRFVDRAWRNPDELRRERSVDCHFYGLNTKWILIHSLWVSTCAKTRTQEQVYMNSHTWNVWNDACQHWYENRRQFISSLASRERDKRERERERGIFFYVFLRCSKDTGFDNGVAFLEPTRTIKSLLLMSESCSLESADTLLPRISVDLVIAQSPKCDRCSAIVKGPLPT